MTLGLAEPTIAELKKVKPVRRKKLRMLDVTHELVAFCPECMAFETLGFTQEGMLPTRKFQQLDNGIFHACGATKPCRLFRSCPSGLSSPPHER